MTLEIPSFIKDKAIGFMKSLFFNPETKEAAEAAEEEGKQERASIWTEAAGSVFKRWCPEFSKFLDIGRTGADMTGIDMISRGPEAVAWEHEFETLTAMSVFIPDFMLRPLTNMFVKTDTFQAMVDHWPMMSDEIKEDLKKDDYDPDNAINAIRIMHQDFVAGKTAASDVIGMIPGLSAAPSA